MNNITASLIKKLRDITKISIMQCKQELINANGDIQLAINNIKQSGITTENMQLKRATTEGIILIKITEDNKYGIILELNSETDFVSRNSKFKMFGDSIITHALNNKITDINILNNQFNKQRIMLISIFKENINIRRIASLEGQLLKHYRHNTKIGVIVSGKESDNKTVNNNKQILKYIAMHIAACNPKYITSNQIPKKFIEQERNIQINIAQKLGKSYEITKKIAEGRVCKFINDISLLNQKFVMDTQKTIKETLNENHIIINDFIRFEVGKD